MKTSLLLRVAVMHQSREKCYRTKSSSRRTHSCVYTRMHTIMTRGLSVRPSLVCLYTSSWRCIERRNGGVHILRAHPTLSDRHGHVRDSLLFDRGPRKQVKRPIADEHGR